MPTATPLPEIKWSQAFASDVHHALPAKGLDPHATGWIAVCGAFCCGPWQDDGAEIAGEVCPTCLQRVRPARWGAYHLHPDGMYRLGPKNAGGGL